MFGLDYHLPAMNNPTNFTKHQANPKVGPTIANIMSKVNGGSQITS